MDIREKLKIQGISFIEVDGEVYTENKTDGKTAQEVYMDSKKQIDICPTKTNQELQEEIENLKTQLEAVHERLCTQQEMSSTVIAHVFGMEALKNE